MKLVIDCCVDNGAIRLCTAFWLRKIMSEYIYLSKHCDCVVKVEMCRLTFVLDEKPVVGSWAG